MVGLFEAGEGERTGDEKAGGGGGGRGWLVWVEGTAVVARRAELVAEIKLVHDVGEGGGDERGFGWLVLLVLLAESDD